MARRQNVDEFLRQDTRYEVRSDPRRLRKTGLDAESVSLVYVPARTTDEPRFLVVGRIGRMYWSGVVTYRENRIRIISVRRSRQEEILIYEG
ncbi:MAG: BrnT family toxin [Gemmatimonadetes bacterium]|mgnify:CR=1 FL=1|jgi:uncharacterized DUF497 family protein|nr:BrnT family toxin [Gemmatimonadota bacterium]